MLDWLCTDSEGSPPKDSWKHAAGALQSRDLVSISRAGGKYSVELTDVGRHLHEHGEYPVDSAGWRQTRAKSHGVASEPVSRSARATRTKTASPEPKPMMVTPPVLSPKLADRRFIRPHPAVRSLRDRPVALPKDAAGRHRGILAADVLVTAATDAGITVAIHEQLRKRTFDTPYKGETLVTLNAGSAEVVVRIGEFERRIEHVKTEEEIERERRAGYSCSRRWDYVPTGLLCFRLYTRLGEPIRMVEAGRKALHEFVPRVIHRVQLATEKGAELEADRQERRRREQERQEAAQALAKRRHQYGTWEKTSLEGVDSWERAQKMRAFVRELEHRAGPYGAEFVAWAEDYLDQLEPVSNFAPPDGDVPDLSHEEEAQLRARPAPPCWIGGGRNCGA